MDIPQHIGFIVDGNRRWARERGHSTLEGHKKGADNIEPIARHAFDKGVKYVSFFVFSTENWKRAQEEVGYLMKLFTTVFKRDGERLVKEGYKVVFQGLFDDRVNSNITKIIDQLEDESKDNDKGTVSFCFNYGGRQEIVDSVKKIAAAGTLIQDIDADLISANLYKPEVPDLDLLVRTSGEQRLSGFQLWRAAYAELIFIDSYWPDLSTSDLDAVLVEYGDRQRRFGGN